MYALGFTHLNIRFSLCRLKVRSPAVVLPRNLMCPQAKQVEAPWTPQKLPAIIRNINQKKDGAGFRIGIDFENIAQNEALILHYYINSIALKVNG